MNFIKCSASSEIVIPKANNRHTYFFQISAICKCIGRQLCHRIRYNYVNYTTPRKCISAYFSNCIW